MVEISAVSPVLPVPLPPPHAGPGVTPDANPADPSPVDQATAGYALVALEQARTLSAAAELLGISQPAFSSRLSEIERLCQTRCFNRINNRLSFTERLDLAQCGQAHPR